MLEGKHANIGNTVGMVKSIHKLTTDPKLAEEITKLFMVESDDCDYKEAPLCTFPRLLAPEDSRDDLPKCMVGRCPLGNLADKERGTADLEFGCGPDVGCGAKSRMMLYGQNTMGARHPMSPEWHRTVGGHVHVGYTGWRKYWNMWKNNMLHGWIDWFKEWPPYLCKHWKTNLLIVIVVFAVYYGAGWLGTMSGG